MVGAEFDDEFADFARRWSPALLRVAFLLTSDRGRLRSPPVPERGGADPRLVDGKGQAGALLLDDGGRGARDVTGRSKAVRSAVSAVIVLVVVGVIVAWWDDDPYDLARTDAAERAREVAGRDMRDYVDGVLGGRDPLATTFLDSCAVDEISNTGAIFSTGPEEVRCTFDYAAVVGLPAETEADAVRLTQEMVGALCEVPAAASRIERTHCSGGFRYGLFDVDATDTARLLGYRLGGAGSHVVAGGGQFDGAALTDRARGDEVGYLLYLESGTEYFSAPLDEPEQAPEPAREPTCQERSGYPSTCPGG
ncbi:hypothetical protein [Blastococcus sp. VKM Ac-2987]|uniref:hypothetical protein n=1 Tax=Blastococcus sp. VKM Ac-2987 TaxID=3004141 RepID=UPI0022AB8C6F|nr:hypothetical protein [Blastococcus sp. VKM Ac-2987]MCZ2858673.1 hypothetical protein [Blastococcus sp. VKM Ac-2987]